MSGNIGLREVPANTPEAKRQNKFIDMNAGFGAKAGCRYGLDSRVAVFTVEMPRRRSNGAWVTFGDFWNSWETNNVTLDAGSELIVMGEDTAANTFTLDVPNVIFTATWIRKDGLWRLAYGGA